MLVISCFQEAQQLIDEVSRQLYDDDVRQSLELYRSEHPDMSGHYDELSDRLRNLSHHLDSVQHSAPEVESSKPGMEDKEVVPGMPGEPTAEFVKPGKVPSREPTPGKEPFLTTVGFTEPAEDKKPEAEKEEPGKKKKGKPEKPSDVLDEPKDVDTIVITEVTRIIKDGKEVLPGMPGEPSAEFVPVHENKDAPKDQEHPRERSKEPSSTTALSDLDADELLPEWLACARWPSRVTTIIIIVFRRILIIERLLKEASSLQGPARQQKLQEAQQLIDEVSRQLYDNDVRQSLELYRSEHPDMSGHYDELSDRLRNLSHHLDSVQHSAPEVESSKPGMEDKEVLLGMPREPSSEFVEPGKEPSREPTPGKEPYFTTIGFTEPAHGKKPQAENEEPGKKKKGKPRKPSDVPGEPKEVDTFVITEVTRVFKDGKEVLPGMPGEPSAEFVEPGKMPSREPTPGKEPYPTAIGFTEPAEDKKPEAEKEEPGKKKKHKPKKPSDVPGEPKEVDTFVITEVTRVFKDGKEVLPGMPGEPSAEFVEPGKVPSREPTPGKEPYPTTIGFTEPAQDKKPEDEKEEPGKKKKHKPKKPSDVPGEPKEVDTFITEVTRVFKDGKELLPGMPGEPSAEFVEPGKVPSREPTPGKEPYPTTIDFTEPAQDKKPEDETEEPGKKKKHKPKKPYDVPGEPREVDTFVITEVTRVFKDGKEVLPGMPGEPSAEFVEPGKVPSREPTPGKEPYPTTIGFTEPAQDKKSEDEKEEPGKKKKHKPKKPSDVPGEPKEVDTFVITEVTRVFKDGKEVLPGMPGEPSAEFVEPGKVPSREATPGKEPYPTTIGFTEPAQDKKLEDEKEEPGKKKKHKPKKPSDVPGEPKEVDTFVITEVTRVFKDGKEVLPGMPGEPSAEFVEPGKMPSRQPTPGKEPYPTAIGFTEPAEDKKPEAEKEEPGKKKKGKPKKPSDVPGEPKDVDTFVITEVTRVFKDGKEVLPGMPGEPSAEFVEPGKMPSREPTPGKEPYPTAIGFTEPAEDKKPEAEKEEPGKKKKSKPKKPSDVPGEPKEVDTFVITEVTRVFKDGKEVLPGMPGEPSAEFVEPGKVPSREPTPGKEPYPTTIGFTEPAEDKKPEAGKEEPGKKKKGKPKKPSVVPGEPKDVDTFVITEVTRVFKDGKEVLPGMPGEPSAEFVEPRKVPSHEPTPGKEPYPTTIGFTEPAEDKKPEAEKEEPGKKKKGKPKKPSDVPGEPKDVDSFVITEVTRVFKDGKEVLPGMPGEPSAEFVEPGRVPSREPTPGKEPYPTTIGFTEPAEEKKPEAEKEEPGKKKKGKPKKPSDVPGEPKDVDTFVITEVTRVFKDGKEVLPGMPGEPSAEFVEPGKVPSREPTPGKEPYPTAIGFTEPAKDKKPEAEKEEPGKKKKGKPKKPSDVPVEPKDVDTFVITEVTRVFKDGKEVLPGMPGEPSAEFVEPGKVPSREPTPGKEPYPTAIGFTEPAEDKKPEAEKEEPGKKKKSKPKKPSDVPGEPKGVDTFVITEVTRVFKDGKEVLPGMPGEPSAEFVEPGKVPSREPTPGKEPYPTAIGFTEPAEDKKPEAEKQEPGKKKKSKPKKPSDVPGEPKDVDTFVITEVTRVFKDGKEVLPGIPGEPSAEFVEPGKVPSREPTPGKEPYPTAIGFTEPAEDKKPEAEKEEPGKKKKSKPEKPFDVPGEPKDVDTFIITEVTRVFKDGKEVLPGMPGEPSAEFVEPGKVPSHEPTPGKEPYPTTIGFTEPAEDKKPEAEKEEPGKKKKGKPKKPSDVPGEPKDVDTFVITEVTRVFKDGKEVLPGMPGEPSAEFVEPGKVPSREPTPGKEPYPTTIGFTEPAQDKKPEDEKEEPGKKKKHKPKKPSDMPGEPKEVDTFVITEVTRVFKDGKEVLPGMPGEPLAEFVEPGKVPSREPTPGKEPYPTTIDFTEPAQDKKPEDETEEPGKKKKHKPKKPYDVPGEPREVDTFVITEVTRVFKDGKEVLPGMPGEPSAEFVEPGKVPSREPTPGKEPYPTTIGFTEPAQDKKPEDEKEEPGKKKKHKPKKPSDVPGEPKEVDTFITEVTRVFKDGKELLPGMPGEPSAEFVEPGKMPSREPTPGKEPYPTAIGFTEPAEDKKPEAEKEEPGKKKKGKPKKPSDVPGEPKDVDTFVITEVTRVFKDGKEVLPGMPGEPSAEFVEPGKMPSREPTPGKEPYPTAIGFTEPAEDKKPEAEKEEPGKKKKSKPKKPSDVPGEPKEVDTFVITEVTRVFKDGKEVLPGMPGEPSAEFVEPRKVPSHEPTPGKEPYPTTIGFTEPAEDKKPEAEKEEPGKKKKGKPKKPSDVPGEPKDVDSFVITEVTRVFKDGKEVLPGMPGEPSAEFVEPGRVPSREPTPGKEPYPTTIGFTEPAEEKKPEAEKEEPGKKKKGKPKKPSDVPGEPKDVDTFVITEVTRVFKDGKEVLPGMPGEPSAEFVEPGKVPSREPTPGKEPYPTAIGFTEPAEDKKPEAEKEEPGKKKKSKPKKPSDVPGEPKDVDTFVITEVTRVFKDGKEVLPGMPGEPSAEFVEPGKVPSREPTPGKEPYPTAIGFTEPAEDKKPEAEKEEPGKKKKSKPKKPSDVPGEPKDVDTFVITEVTRVFKDGKEVLPGIPGEPSAEFVEPGKVPSREPTPGKEPYPTAIGFTEPAEDKKPEAEKEEPGKKKKSKPEKPFDVPGEPKDVDTFIITEVTRVFKDGKEVLPGMPGEPSAEFVEPGKVPSHEPTPGKEPYPTTIGFTEPAEDKKPEAEKEEPGKKKKGKPKKPSDVPGEPKDVDTFVITEVTRVFKDGKEVLPGMPGEPSAEFVEPGKVPSREPTPGKEPYPTTIGFTEPAQDKKPEDEKEEPGKKKKHKPKKPSDMPGEPKEVDTFVITEVTRVFKDGKEVLPGMPGEPLAEFVEPGKVPSREPTPGKEPYLTTIGFTEPAQDKKPEDEKEEPGKKKKHKPKKPSDMPGEPKEVDTFVITEVTRVFKDGKEVFPGMPGETSAEFVEPGKVPSREPTPGKEPYPTTIGFTEPAQDKKPEDEKEEPGKKKKRKPKKPSDVPGEPKEVDTFVITEVTRVFKDGKEVLPGMPGEPSAEFVPVCENKDAPKDQEHPRERSKEPLSTTAFSDVDAGEPLPEWLAGARWPSQVTTIIIIVFRRILIIERLLKEMSSLQGPAREQKLQEDKELLSEMPREPSVEFVQPATVPSREPTPGKEPYPTTIGFTEPAQDKKPEDEKEEPGKKKKHKPKKPSDVPGEPKEVDTFVITEVTRVFNDGKEVLPGMPGEPSAEFVEPGKVPSREPTPGKEPYPTTIGFTEPAQDKKPEDEKEEPGKKKKHKPKKPSDVPGEPREVDTFVITEVTRVFKDGKEVLPGMPGEPSAEFVEPGKVPSREPTPGKEPYPTTIGFTEPAQDKKPEDEKEEPGKKKKHKPKKPSDVPGEPKEVDTFITEVTRVFKDGKEVLPGMPGEPSAEFVEPGKVPSREPTPGKEPYPTTIGFTEPAQDKKPEDEMEEPGKKKKHKPKKPSDMPGEPKEVDTFITEVTRVFKDGKEVLPGMPGEPSAEFVEPGKVPSREPTPGKESYPTTIGFTEPAQDKKSEDEKEEPGKKKKHKPKKPFDVPGEPREVDTFVITEVTRVFKDGKEVLPGMPGEPSADFVEPGKVPSREPTPGKEPYPTTIGFTEPAQDKKPEDEKEEPGKKKKHKPKKPSDVPGEPKEVDTFVVTEVTRVFKDGKEVLPGMPGEPSAEFVEPGKVPSREPTPGKEPYPTTIGFTEPAQDKKPEDEKEEPGKKKKHKPKKPSDVPGEPKEVDTFVISKVTRVFKEGKEVLPGMPGEPSAEFVEPGKVPSREPTPGKEPYPTTIGFTEPAQDKKPEDEKEEPGKKKKHKPKKPSDVPGEPKEVDTFVITEVTRVFKDGKEVLPGMPGEPSAEFVEPEKVPSRELTPGKESYPTTIGFTEPAQDKKPEDEKEEPGKKKKHKPKKPSDVPGEPREVDTFVITEVTRVFKDGKEVLPGMPGEPSAEFVEPGKVPSREPTPGKEPYPTTIGFTEPAQDKKPEDEMEEPGKKKKHKPKKPSDMPGEPKEVDTFITEVTRVFKDGKEVLPGMPGEPSAEFVEPGKVPSREPTPGKEPYPTTIGFTEPAQAKKPEDEKEEPGKKKKHKPKKPSDVPGEPKEVDTFVITEVTRVFKDGKEVLPGMPGEPSAEFVEPGKVLSREPTPGKEPYPTTIGFTEPAQDKKPEDEKEEPGKKKKHKPKKPSDVPGEPKEVDTFVITEVTRVFKDGKEVLPGMPGEPSAEFVEPGKVPSREPTPGKEPYPTTIGFTEPVQDKKPEDEKEEPGKKKKHKPKKPSDVPGEPKEVDTFVITEVTRVFKDSKEVLPGMPGEPSAEFVEPGKVPSREPTPGKEPYPTTIGFTEPAQDKKPEDEKEEPGKKKKHKPKKPSDVPGEPKEVDTFVITEVTRVFKDGKEVLPGMPGEPSAEFVEPEKVPSRELTPGKEPYPTTIGFTEPAQDKKPEDEKEEPGKKKKHNPKKPSDVPGEPKEVDTFVITEVTRVFKDGKEVLPGMPGEPSAEFVEPGKVPSREPTPGKEPYPTTIGFTEPAQDKKPEDEKEEPGKKKKHKPKKPSEVPGEPKEVDTFVISEVTQVFKDGKEVLPGMPGEPSAEFVEPGKVPSHEPTPGKEPYPTTIGFTEPAQAKKPEDEKEEPGKKKKHKPKKPSDVPGEPKEVDTFVITEVTRVFKDGKEVLPGMPGEPSAEFVEPEKVPSRELTPGKEPYPTTIGFTEPAQDKKPEDEKEEPGKKKKHKPKKPSDVPGEPKEVDTFVITEVTRVFKEVLSGMPGEPSAEFVEPGKVPSREPTPGKEPYPTTIGFTEPAQDKKPEDEKEEPGKKKKRKPKKPSDVLGEPKEVDTFVITEVTRVFKDGKEVLPGMPGEPSAEFVPVCENKDAPKDQEHPRDHSKEPLSTTALSDMDAEEPLPEWLVGARWPSRVTTVIIIVFRRILIIERLLKEATFLQGAARQQKLQEAQQLIDEMSRQLYDDDVCQILELYHSEYPDMAGYYGELSDRLQNISRHLDSVQSSAPQGKPGM
ncbi:hypothetical protein V5799_015172, partial [Amblyomma americanum]